INALEALILPGCSPRNLRASEAMTAGQRGGGEGRGAGPGGPAPRGCSGAGGGERLLRGLDHGLGGEAELAEEGLGVGGGAVVLERDGPAVDAEEAVPRHRDAGL